MLLAEGLAIRCSLYSAWCLNDAERRVIRSKFALGLRQQRQNDHVKGQGLFSILQAGCCGPDGCKNATQSVSED